MFNVKSLIPAGARGFCFYVPIPFANKGWYITYTFFAKAWKKGFYKTKEEFQALQNYGEIYTTGLYEDEDEEILYDWDGPEY